MDGLLIDSEPLWRRAEIEVFARIGLSLTDQNCEQTMGLRTDEVVSYWYERSPWVSPSRQSVADAIDSRVTELIVQHPSPLPGAVQAVSSVHEAGLQVGLASSSSMALICAVVAALGLDDLFEVLCSADDEPLGKPHPGVYLTAAGKLGVDAQECVAFEDSEAGVASAKAAGMRVIAVPASHQLELPGFEAADLKLRSLEEFTIKTLEML
jgi:sugar-phosphatase